MSDNEEVLKSLGLYWRHWPEEKPQNGQIVFLKCLHSEGLRIQYAKFIKSSAPDRSDAFYWNNQSFEPSDWMLASGLEVLP